MKSFWRAEAGTLVLTVRVQPGARHNAVVGVADGALRLKLAAPAIEGRANDALCAYLAELLGTAKSRVEILKGESGRLKRVAVRGAKRDPATLLKPLNP